MKAAAVLWLARSSLSNTFKDSCNDDKFSGSIAF